MSLRRSLLSHIASAMLALVTILPSTAAPPASPWMTQDIGTPCPPGSTDVDANGIWTLQGGGEDIWGQSDQFHFAYQRIRGDASITARFLTQEGDDGDFSKVGLMVRENETPGSPNLDYAMTPGQGLWAQERSRQDAATANLLLVGPSNRPETNLWLRLQRAGNEIAGFYSRDGSVWAQASFSPRSLPMLSEEALLGLAVSSHVAGSLLTAKFDQVSLEPGMIMPYGLQTCGGNRAVLLQWRPLKTAVAYNVYRGPAAARDQLVKLTADAVAGASFTDTSAGPVNGTPVVYAVAAVFRRADGSEAEGPLVAALGTPVAVPAGWMGCSLNEGPRPGSAVFDGATGEITLRGSGFGFADTPADVTEQGYFLGQAVEGDVQITVRMLTSPTGKGGDRIAGLTIRESLDGGARYVLFGIQPAPRSFPDNLSGLLRQWRTTANVRPRRSLSIRNSALKLPVVLRLTRRGNVITPEYSLDDGKTFQADTPITFASSLANTLHVGLAISGGTGFGARDGMSEARFNGLEINKL
jgi:regulation of enolase protein 1 (concanavalin A-like superfamily)